MQAMPLHVAIGSPMPSPKTNIENEICQIALQMVNVANDNQLLLHHPLADFWHVLGKQHICIVKSSMDCLILIYPNLNSSVI